MSHSHPVAKTPPRRRNVPGWRSLLASIVGTSLLLTCCDMPQPTTAAAPVLSPLPTSAVETASFQKHLATESFDTGVTGWQGWTEGEALSRVTWEEAGQLLWSVQAHEGSAAALAYAWPELTAADGLTIRLRSLDRSALVVLAVQEADESAYGLILPLSRDRITEHSLLFETFALLQGSEDENSALDRHQLTTLFLIDIAGHLGTLTPNRIAINEVVLWEGTLAPFDLSCSADNSPPLDAHFRTGVDANYIPQGEISGRGFWAGEQRVDPLELFAVNGVDAFRVRLWVGYEGESGLEYATDLALRAQDAGLRPYLAMFLTEGWADVNKQPAPTAWANLSLDERAEAIRRYARQAARHFLDAGIDLDFYEIGNEIDYGICGVFADTTQPRDVASLRESVWPDAASLIRAAIAGVGEVDPDARFMLHIATSWDPDFAVAYFQTMSDLGVAYDYVGLSFYPSAFGVAACERFCDTLDRLRDEVGKPVILAETAYPSHPPSGGMFADWRRSLPGYPLTPEGQARWLADVLAGMRERGDVAGVYVFSPDFWFSGEIWSPFALFDDQGRALPAIASFKTKR